MIDDLDRCLDNISTEVTNFCNNGHCSGCGQCCSDILMLSDKEVAVIARYVAKKHIKPTVRTKLPKVGETIDLVCPFLDDSKSCNKCKIYPVRPKICRAFQCDLPAAKIQLNKTLIAQTRQPYSMRLTFFS